MPSRLIQIEGKHHFLTERYDRINGEKIHTQTLAAMNPDATSYEDLFEVCRKLSIPASEQSELYRRMVFNVMGGNVDDHIKNFSFLMERNGTWHITPAYDMTFTTNLDGAAYENAHSMSIAGKDYAASRGEYLNGIIMANYLGYEFIDAATVICFDKDGEFDSEKTNAVCEAKFANIERAVVPGFYGAMPNGKVKTFSRGGSDVTGSIVARALKADMYENWTDVSGFLAADPRIVNNAKPINVITYKELRELSYMGASVLHESAIFPVRKGGIPINIKNTNAPEDKGTMIVETTCNMPEYTITGIAGKKGFVAISIDKDMMNSEIGFCRKVLSVFEDNGISIEHMPSGIDTMTVFVHQDEFVEKEQKVLAQIHKAVNPDSVELEANLALIAVVGRGMKNSTGIAGNIFSALAKAKINVKMIDQGSSELNIIIGVRNRYFEDAIKTIYGVFVPEE